MAGEMPERIWADIGSANPMCGGWNLNAARGTEYVSASTHTRAMEALAEAERENKAMSRLVELMGEAMVTITRCFRDPTLSKAEAEKTMEDIAAEVEKWAAEHPDLIAAAKGEPK